MKRQFLMLAHTYKNSGHIGGWFISEKLDGHRAFWDGGISRGVPKAQVPFANTTKDSRYVIPPIATGLWSRYGNVIHAPDWWLDQLPKMPLDGELKILLETRQETAKVIKQINPSDRWSEVIYSVFDAPSYEVVFAEGVINVPNFVKVLDENVLPWALKRAVETGVQHCPRANTPFRSTVKVLEREINSEAANLEILPQIRLPNKQSDALDQMDVFYEDVLEAGGEGVILRRDYSRWVAGRSHSLLKVKPFEDCEVEIVGYIAGKGKYLGMIGAFITDYNGQRLEISGFTDEERIIGSHDRLPEEDGYAIAWCQENPGKDCPGWITSPQFPRKTKITIKHRGFTDAGLPCEARYWRKF
jgi:DNA ligase-1